MRNLYELRDILREWRETCMYEAFEGQRSFAEVKEEYSLITQLLNKSYDCDRVIPYKHWLASMIKEHSEPWEEELLQQAYRFLCPERPREDDEELLSIEDEPPFEEGMGVPDWGELRPVDDARFLRVRVIGE